MTSPTTTQQAEIQRCMTLPAIQALHDHATGVSLERTAVLYTIARTHYDVPSSLGCVERALRDSRNPVDAWNRLRSQLPGQQRPRLDGSLITVRLPTQTPSARLVAAPGGGDAEYRESISQWQVHPEALLLWRHGWGPVWNRRAAAIGDIVGTQVDPITRDMTLWCRVTDPAAAENCLYGMVSASPGIDLAGSEVEHGFDRRAWEPVQTWRTAVIRELSLTEPGEQALTVRVNLAARCPDTAAAAWAQTRATAGHTGQQHRTAAPASRDAAPVGPEPTVTAWTTRGPGGTVMQHRSWPVHRR